MFWVFLNYLLILISEGEDEPMMDYWPTSGSLKRLEGDILLAEFYIMVWGPIELIEFFFLRLL
jgi:hypothetical protein